MRQIQSKATREWFVASLVLPMLTLATWISSQQASGQEKPVADDAELERVAEGFSFTEGPAADSKGNVYFTDQPNDQILRFGIDGQLSTFMKPAGRSNGLFIDRDNVLWACADEENQLWKIDLTSKAREVVVERFDDKLLNGPNDCWVAPSGVVYFTDPFYKRPYWKRGEIEQDAQAIYRFNPKDGKTERIEAEFVKPNGIVGSWKQKRLFVADIGANKTYVFSISDEGELSDRKLFCEQGSDGMTLDEEGNLYLTGRGVTVYNSSGQQIQQIDVPENWTANICFGGPDHSDLFITASKGLYRVRTKTRGITFDAE